MGKCASIDRADGNPGRGVEPADVRNETDMLIVLSIESEILGSSGVPHVHLGGTWMWMDDANGPGNGADALSCQPDVSKGQADASRGFPDALSTSNNAETEVIGHSDDLGTYLGAGDVKRDRDETSGIGSHMDMPSWHGDDLHSTETNMNKPAEELQIVSIPQEKAKLPDSPMKTVKWTLDEPNGLGNQTDRSSVCTYVHCVGNDVGAAEKEAENVRTPRNRQKTQNSPNAHEIAMPEPICQCKRVSIDNIDVYVPCNAPVEALG